LKNIHRFLGCVIFLLVVLSLPALALDPSKWGVGVNYGIVNHFKYWNCASTESGSVLQVQYSYDFNDFYTAALDLAFIADSNTFNNPSIGTYTQTSVYLVINHLFYFQKRGTFAPYLKFGTGIYAANLWIKQSAGFSSRGNDVMADLNAGCGADFNFGKSALNIDFNIPGLGHEMFAGQALKNYTNLLTFGYKYHF